MFYYILWCISIWCRQYNIVNIYIYIYTYFVVFRCKVVYIAWTAYIAIFFLICFFYTVSVQDAIICETISINLRFFQECAIRPCPAEWAMFPFGCLFYKEHAIFHVNDPFHTVKNVVAAPRSAGRMTQVCLSDVELGCFGSFL